MSPPCAARCCDVDIPGKTWCVAYTSVREVLAVAKKGRPRHQHFCESGPRRRSEPVIGPRRLDLHALWHLPSLIDGSITAGQRRWFEEPTRLPGAPAHSVRGARIGQTGSP